MAMDTSDFLLDDVGQWLGAFASPTVLIELASLLVCVGLAWVVDSVLVLFGRTLFSKLGAALRDPGRSSAIAAGLLAARPTWRCRAMEAAPVAPPVSSAASMATRKPSQTAEPSSPAARPTRP